MSLCKKEGKRKEEVRIIMSMYVSVWLHSWNIGGGCNSVDCPTHYCVFSIVECTHPSAQIG